MEGETFYDGSAEGFTDTTYESGRHTLNVNEV